jgi:hypothetical protein
MPADYDRPSCLMTTCLNCLGTGTDVLESAIKRAKEDGHGKD